MPMVDFFKNCLIFELLGRYEFGTEVLLKSLKTRTDLNGQRGIIVEQPNIRRGRHAVQLSDGCIISIKDQNLEEPPPAAKVCFFFSVRSFGPRASLSSSKVCTCLMIITFH